MKKKKKTKKNILFSLFFLTSVSAFCLRVQMLFSGDNALGYMFY